MYFIFARACICFQCLNEAKCCLPKFWIISTSVDTILSASIILQQTHSLQQNNKRTRRWRNLLRLLQLMCFSKYFSSVRAYIINSRQIFLLSNLATILQIFVKVHKEDETSIKGHRCQAEEYYEGATIAFEAFKALKEESHALVEL